MNHIFYNMMMTGFACFAFVFVGNMILNLEKFKVIAVLFGCTFMLSLIFMPVGIIGYFMTLP